MKIQRLLWIVVAAAFLIVPAMRAGAEEKAFKEFHTIVEADLVKKVVEQEELGMIIDARPKKTKFDKGHIPGAVSMYQANFEKMKNLLPADKNALLIFYCEGLECALSHGEAYTAEAMGYKNVKVYAKGYPEWKKLYPGICDESAAAAVPAAAPAASAADLPLGIKPGKQEGSIDHESFKKLIADNKDKIILVDNRAADEFARGTIPGAINIPPDSLEKMLKDWKVDKPVVFFCGTGARSGESYYMVKDKRPDIKHIWYVDGVMKFDGKGGFTVN